MLAEWLTEALDSALLVGPLLLFGMRRNQRDRLAQNHIALPVPLDEAPAVPPAIQGLVRSSPGIPGPRRWVMSSSAVSSHGCGSVPFLSRQGPIYPAPKNWWSSSSQRSRSSRTARW
jgi:hypothetical protein